MPIDRTRTARGALAGSLAAAAWAAQSRLDVRLFGVRHYDQELLGKAVARGRAALPLGWAIHVANGALFGAAYAQLAPRLPLARWARGPALGLAEHVATWPLVAVSDRVHPARDELPRLAGSPRAFAQSAWRHLLFGALLGLIEARLNGDEHAAPEPAPTPASSNGHGDIEHAVGVVPR